MGVVTSVPETIKIHLRDIQSTKTDYVLDSVHYENNYEYIRKAISELSKNKSIQKVNLKLFLHPDSKFDLSRSIYKLLSVKSTIIIYGMDLNFFEHPQWVKNWARAKVTNLQLKFEFLPTSFEHLVTGLSRNQSVKILGFRYLSDFQLGRLEHLLMTNSSIYHLQIALKHREFGLENNDEGIHSSKTPSTPQIGHASSFLMHNKSVNTLTLSGLHNRASFIMGISNNFSVKTLVLESIEIEKHLRSDWNLAFKTNSFLTEVKVIRGLNTLSALILFQSLRKNKSLVSLVLEECVFFDQAFLGFENFLKVTKNLQSLHLRNLLHLNINQFSQSSSLQNLSKILLGVAENTSILDVYIMNYAASSNSVLKLEKIENLLSNCFFQLFTKNKTLKNLSIENFRIGSESFQGISEGLGGNNSIESFSIVGNLIHWDDLLKFSIEILKNSTLKSVNFMNNDLFSSVKEQDSALIERIFENLIGSNLQRFKIEPWFWSHNTYSLTNPEILSALKSKFM